jgi:hypothetical protein
LKEVHPAANALPLRNCNDLSLRNMITTNGLLSSSIYPPTGICSPEKAQKPGCPDGNGIVCA